MAKAPGSTDGDKPKRKVAPRPVTVLMCDEGGEWPTIVMATRDATLAMDKFVELSQEGKRVGFGRAMLATRKGDDSDDS